MGARRLSARGIELRAGDRTLISGLELEVTEGQTLAVVGPSGAGKTTLLRALCLLDEPAAGEVLWDGAPPADVPAFRRSVVYLPQRPTLLGPTVGAELSRAFDYASSNGKFDEARAKHLLAEVAIAPAWEAQVEPLSEGERQRICLVRALLLEPAFLLLDEPTSALDPASTRLVERLLHDFLLRGGLVLVSHDRAQRDRFQCQEVRLS